MHNLEEKHSSIETSVMRRISKAEDVVNDRVAVEVPVGFSFNCENYTVMMASPTNLIDFGYGFAISEGIVSGINEIFSVDSSIKSKGINLSIKVPEFRAEKLLQRERNIEGRTGCGLCGVKEINNVLRQLKVLPESSPINISVIIKALKNLPSNQLINKQTGSVHAAAFVSNQGSFLCIREDVGRHNALDKLIGSVAQSEIDPASGFVIVTSRCSMEMVQKTVTFGCPVLVSVSAPTSLALEIANESNLTVAAFARGERINIYTKTNRII